MANMARKMNEDEVIGLAHDEPEEHDEMPDDGPDKEPGKDATIKLSLPAMAAVLVTVCNRRPDENTLKSMVEALAEISKGKTLEMDDLDAVADHMNNEETGEIENREDGHPDHEDIGGAGGEECIGIEGGEEPRVDHEHWPGDMDPTKSGKNKLLDCGSPVEMEENFYISGEDVMWTRPMSEADEIRMLQ